MPSALIRTLNKFQDVPGQFQLLPNVVDLTPRDSAPLPKKLRKPARPPPAPRVNHISP